jgi:hypothetical protein
LLFDGAFTPAATRPTLRLERDVAEGQNSSLPGMNLMAACGRRGLLRVTEAKDRKHEHDD